MAEWAKELFNYGTLGMFVAGLIWVIYAKIIPWGERYISSTENFMKGMETRDIRQQELCNAHAENLGRIADLGETQAELLKASHDSIKALVQRLEHPDAPFSTIKTNQDIARMKKAAVRACEMCKLVAEKEFPTSANEVGRHCNEIERIINEA